ncbi:MAG: 2,3-bisphosphoglycerate-independent phosphoglycerate mutase, partial [Desulfuromonadales bacterium]
MRKPVALIILDGWGINENCQNNAVCQAQTPRLDEFAATYPTSWLNASGLNVGLPDGQMGNSEVGHLNIGAGRIVYQELTRISRSIDEGDFFTNQTFLDALSKIRRAGGRLHLLGLLSDGGVHSHNTHLYALLKLAKQAGVDACVHAFMDGRDTPPRSGAGYLEELEAEMARLGHGCLATVAGRYYAMDRDNRWDRVEKAWRAIALGEGQPAGSGAEAIGSAYDADQTDEFVEPRVILHHDTPAGVVNDGDGIFFFNFRADRAREITRAFTLPGFAAFARPSVPRLSTFVCMTEYDATFELPIAFSSESLHNILGEVVAA